MEKLIVNFISTNGIVIEDIRAEKFAKTIILNPTHVNYQINTSNMVLFDAFRTLMVEGLIGHDEIIFQHNGTPLNHNKYGVLKEYELDMCIHTSLVERLLLRAIKLRKIERENKNVGQNKINNR